MSLRRLVLRNGNDTVKVTYTTDMVDDNIKRFTIMGTTGLTDQLKADGFIVQPKENSIDAMKLLASGSNLQLDLQTSDATTNLVAIATALSISTSATLTAGTHSVVYAGVTLAAVGGNTGTGNTYALTGGAWPTGITMTTGGVIAGTPGAGTAGTYNPIVTVTDKYGMTASKTFTLVIA